MGTIRDWKAGAGRCRLVLGDPGRGGTHRGPKWDLSGGLVPPACGGAGDGAGLRGADLASGICG